MEFGTNRLIVELSSTGHHPVFLEYVIGYLKLNTSKIKTTLLLNEIYTEKYYHLKLDNVEFVFLNQEKIDELKKGTLIKKSIKITNYIHSFAKSNSIRQVILLDMNIFQFGLILKRGVFYKGIIFSQFFRQDRLKSNAENLRYIKRKYLVKLLIMNKYISNVFFLNDDKGVDCANLYFKTNKLISIPDPVEEFEFENIYNIKKEYNIPETNLVLLHYGSFDGRKGSLLILESLLEIDENYYNNITLIYAGSSKDEVLNNNITKSIIALRERGLNIIYINEYIEKQKTQSLFVHSDYCLCPYTSVEASSGSVGLSIASDTMIIGPDEGLLGEIIKSSGLGITIKQLDKEKLKRCLIEDVIINKVKTKGKVDIKSRSPYEFAKKILL